MAELHDGGQDSGELGLGGNVKLALDGDNHPLAFGGHVRSERSDGHVLAHGPPVTFATKREDKFGN